MTDKEALAVVAIEQLVNRWAADLDHNEGQNIEALLSPSVRYAVNQEELEGRQAVGDYYRARLERLRAEPDGPPLQRHPVANLVVDFDSETSARGTFLIIYFMALPADKATTDFDGPYAVADCQMAFERTDEGQWLISKFDSGQPFRR